MKYIKIMIITGLLALSASALAHTGIKSTTPNNEEILAAAPEELILNFRAPVRLMKVVLKANESEALDIGFKPSAKASKSFNIALPELGVGDYTANWTSMGKDGHKMKGDFSFSIKTDVIEKPDEEKNE